MLECRKNQAENVPYLWVSIDPGHTTGIVSVYQDKTKSSFYLDQGFSIPAYDILSTLHMLQPDYVVLEGIPTVNANVRTVYVFEATQFFCRSDNRQIPLWIVKPGSWKPVVKRLEWKANSSLSDRHQKHAFLMMRFLIWSRFGFDMGECDVQKKA